VSDMTQEAHRIDVGERTRTDFVSMLAHELRGPMTTVKGFGEALRDQWEELPAERRRRMLDLLTTEIDRLSRLVDDLLDVSRMEAGTLRYELEATSISELVDDMLEVHPSIRAAHSVVSKVPSELPMVLADRDRMRQVLLNLLTNATRYSPEGTTVTIAAEPIVDDGTRCAKVTVEDQGIGIAANDRDRVFSKFVMLPKPVEMQKGIGLGLFITKEIVEAHGGRIWAESEPGGGSRFSFTLRIVDESPSIAAVGDRLP
jgi:signal transduction histidine kinase